MNEHDPQMIKGVLGLLLLTLCLRQSDYGYSLVLRLRQFGFEGLAEGSVYPALTRLEAQGHLDSELVRSSSGPARKYYRVTPAGQIEIDRAQSAWQQLVSGVARALTDPASMLRATSEEELS